MAAPVKTLNDILDQIISIHQSQQNSPEDDVDVHHNRKVHANNQTISVGYDGRMVSMKMNARSSDLPRVYFPDLLSSTQHLLGEKKRVELSISNLREHITLSGKMRVYYGDIGEFVDHELIGHQGIISGASKIVVGKNTFSLGYGVLDRERGIYIVTLPNKLKHNRMAQRRIFDAYSAVTRASAYGWRFFLPNPLKNFESFEKLALVAARILNATRYYVHNAEVEIPIGELRFVKLPPRFRLSSKGLYGPKSLIEYSCRTPEGEGLDGMCTIQSFKLEFPASELPRVVQFYDCFNAKLRNPELILTKPN